MSSARGTRWLLRALALVAFATSLAYGISVARQDASKRYEDLVQRYETVKAEAKKKALEEGKSLRNPPGAEFIADFEKLAAEAKGSDTGARCWIKVVELGAYHGKLDQLELAEKTLLSDCSESPALAEVVPLMNRVRQASSKDAADQFLRDVIAKSPHKSVQAPALLALAQALRARKTDEATAEARKLLERLAKEFDDVKSPSGTSYAKLAAAEQPSSGGFGIGETAPDFAAVDENGTKFKLSDYRGKVVVIDFWGFW